MKEREGEERKARRQVEQMRKERERRRKGRRMLFEFKFNKLF